MHEAFGGYLVGGEVSQQGAAAFAGPAQAKPDNCLVRQPAPAQIGERRTAAGREQLCLVKPRGFLQHAVQVQALPFGFLGLARRLGQIQPGFGGQRLHRLHEGGTLRLHDEADGVAVRAAAEAMVVIVIGVEAGRLFAMEGAAGFPVAAAAGQFDPPADERR